jgi:predicted RNA-binding protein with PIN domain
LTSGPACVAGPACAAGPAFGHDPHHLGWNLAMHLVIDGYNLIHNCLELLTAHQQGQGRHALAAALRIYRQKKGHKVTVVFDGGPEHQPLRGSLDGVPVVYSGGELSADEMIVEMARRGGPGLTVVTCDRALGEACRRLGAELVPADVFAGRLMGAAQGCAGGGEEDREGWNFSTRKKGPARREPKARRRKSRQLEKL